jgi:anti-sigma B factor antagonist/stage II sporulation protein AA (anti-sigma F factor antagonist)
MEISITGGIPTIIAISGRLDTINAPDFERTITPVMESDMTEVILDCTALDYISSAGLRLFLTLQKVSSSKQGKLILRKIKTEIKEIFDMTGFSSIFCFE